VEKAGVPVINQKCIRWRKLDGRFLRQTAREAFDHLSPHLRLRRGDVLWNSTGTGTIGRAVVYDGHLGEATVDSHVTIVRPQRINSDFVCAYIETMRVQHLVMDANVGSTNQLELPRSFVENLLIPVPPPAEQLQIMMKIDELFTAIADGNSVLVRAHSEVETWRCALLRAAVIGQLTREWREQNSSETSGAKLIRSWRRAVSLLRGELDFNVSPESDGLPESWAWTAVGEAGELRLGRQRAPQHHAGRHMRPYLRVANVFEAKIDLTDVKSMNFTPDEFETYCLRPGDVLLNEGQSLELLGRPAIYRGEIDGCCFQNTLLRFRPNEGLLPEFALLVFRYYLRSGRFKREGRITTNLAHLSQTRCAAIEFPVPPTAEQAEIVKRVSFLEEEISEHFNQIENTAIELLRQSVLRAAFRGQLRAQKSTDIPSFTSLENTHAANNATIRSSSARKPTSHNASHRVFP
jgi:type I restriction enzyme S subunit